MSFKANKPDVIQYGKIAIFLIVLFSLYLPSYGQALELERAANILHLKMLRLSVQEAESVIKAHNLWILASNDAKEIKGLQKNINGQEKHIRRLKKSIDIFEKIVNKPIHEQNLSTPKGLRLGGTMSGQNSQESNKFIDIYGEKAAHARRNALKENREQWLEAAHAWDGVVKIVEKIVEITSWESDMLLLSAEITKPGIVSNKNRNILKEMENNREKIIQKAMEVNSQYYNESF